MLTPLPTHIRYGLFGLGLGDAVDQALNLSAVGPSRFGLYGGRIDNAAQTRSAGAGIALSPTGAPTC